MTFDPADPPDSRTVSADVIRQAVLDEKPVEIEYGIITGSLILDSLTHHHEFSLVNCVVEELAAFSFVKFEKVVDLRDTEFKRGVHCASSRLEQDCILDGSQFTDGDFVFDNSTVGGRFLCGRVLFSQGVRVSIESAHFARKALFNRTTFGGKTSFQSSLFASDAIFTSTSFSAETSFVDMTCDGDLRFDRDPAGPGPSSLFQAAVDFSGSTVVRRVHFEDTQFDSIAKFEQVTFSKDTSFQRVIFKKGVNLFGSRLGPSEFNGLVCDGNGDFSGTVFEGDVSFEPEAITGKAARFGDKADFTGAEIRGQFSFQNVTVQGETSFNGAIIKLDAYFNSTTPGSDGCSFQSSVDFIGLQVGGVTLFDAARFAKELVFKKARLSQDGYFRSCRFSGGTDFSGVEFAGDCDASASRFKGEARFDRCRFGGLVDFSTVDFQTNASFENIVITGASKFNNVLFGRNVNFRGAKFQGEAYFQSTRFTRETGFIDCNFEALVSFFADNTSQPPTTFNTTTFEHSRFQGGARFNKCSFQGPTSFADTSFRSVSFDSEGHQFESTVNLAGCRYDHIVTNWRHLFFAEGRSRLAPYDREAGIQLEGILRKVGEDEEATEMYLKRKSVERRQKWGRREYISWFADLLYKVFANYGVRARTLLIPATILIATGTFMFSFPSTIVPAQEKDANLKPLAWSNLKALGVSIHQFLPIDVPVGSEWKPSPGLLDISVSGHRVQSRYIRPTGLATMLLRIPGWILVPLAVANLAGILRRSGTPAGT